MNTSKEKQMKIYKLDKYVLKYSEDKVQLVEIISEDITGIVFLRKDNSEIVGKFLILEESILDIQELYSTHYQINDNEITLFF